MNSANAMPPQEITDAAIKIVNYFHEQGARSFEIGGLRSRFTPPENAEGETLAAYQTVKDWAHRLEAILETIMAHCDNHADGAPDATDLGKFSNEIIGMINEIHLGHVRTLRGKADAVKFQLSHPTIHVEYYKWLGKKENEDFVKKYCPDFQNFHAIAMWVWSRSRETAREAIDKP